MCLIALCGGIAHAVLLGVILFTPNLRHTPSNSFVISLSMSGLLASLSLFPFAIYVYLDFHSQPRNGWETGTNCSTNYTILSSELCSAFQILHNFSIYHSTWLATSIAIERSVSITLPFYVPSPFRYILLNLIILISSFMLAIAPIFSPSNSPCYSLFSYNLLGNIFLWIQFLFIYLIPMIVILLVYAKIYRISQKAQNAIRQTPSSNSDSNQTAVVTLRIWTIDPPTTISRNPPNHHTNTYKNKAVRTLVLICGTYMVCWSPYSISHLTSNLRFEEFRPCTFLPIYVRDNNVTVVAWLMYTAMVINPLLYGLLNRAIRTEIRCKIRAFCLHLSRYGQPTTGNEELDDDQVAENFW